MSPSPYHLSSSSSCTSASNGLSPTATSSSSSSLFPRLCANHPPSAALSPNLLKDFNVSALVSSNYTQDPPDPAPTSSDAVVAPFPSLILAPLPPSPPQITRNGRKFNSLKDFLESSKVYSDEGTAMDENENTSGGNLDACEGDTIAEPCEGMEFDSEEAAKVYYDNYACSVGFVMRVMSCRRSERDGKITTGRLGCNKEGNRVNRVDNSNKPRKPKPVTREGCKVILNLKYISGKWVVAKFVSEHNHPLDAPFLFWIAD